MAARPVITFDFDGVLCRPPLGINPGRGIGKERRAECSPSPLRFTEPYRFLGRRPMPGAAKAFQSLSAEYECIVLTARLGRSRALTARWLARHIAAGIALEVRTDDRETPSGFKVRRTSELGALAHFEDDPHTALWVAESLPAVFLVDWRRNRWLNGVPNIHRVRTLDEAAPTLRALAESAARIDAGRERGVDPA